MTVSLCRFHPVLSNSVWALLVVAGLPSWSFGQITWSPVGWGEIRDVPDADSDEYFAMLRADYQFREQSDYVQYTIDIRVNPCYDAIKTGMLGENCCRFTNVHGCQDVPQVHAGDDLQIAYFQNAHIVSCRGTAYQQDPNCGTFIEVHRKMGDTVTVLADVRVDVVALPSGYQTTSVATYKLCLGDYELWWVVRSRAGPFVQKIKGFKVLTPTCNAPPGEIPPQRSTKKKFASSD